MEYRYKLAICIPAYNYKKYLMEALDSCVDDLADQCQVIVLDNNSNDGTDELRSEYSGRKGVYWYRNDEVLDIEDNWNRCIEYANAEWIKLLQADDRMKSGSIEQILNLINKINVDFIGHQMDYINKEGMVIGKTLPYEKNGLPIYTDPSYGVKLKLQNIARLRECSGNIFKKNVWCEIGGYKKDCIGTLDINFNIAMLSKFKGCLVDQNFVELRRHDASVGKKLDPTRAIHDLDKTIKIIKELATNADELKKYSKWCRGWRKYRIYEQLYQTVRLRRYSKLKDILPYILQEILSLAGLGVFINILIRRLLRGDIQKTIKIENLEKYI